MLCALRRPGRAAARAAIALGALDQGAQVAAGDGLPQGIYSF